MALQRCMFLRNLAIWLQQKLGLKLVLLETTLIVMVHSNYGA